MAIENEMTKEEFDKQQKKIKREKHEILFAHQLEMFGFQEWGGDELTMPSGHFLREFRFHDVRRWRVDFLIALKENHKYFKPMIRPSILVEIEGGTHSRGRHTRGKGYAKDCEKYNHAVLNGWLLFRFTGEMVQSGEAISWLQKNIFGGE